MQNADDTTTNAPVETQAATQTETPTETPFVSQAEKDRKKWSPFLETEAEEVEPEETEETETDDDQKKAL